ncbi:MAG TPA: DUF2809 domain-containing protein [Flavobacterium sp.]|jgi:hypothetical protein|nr:DUF2809 domain-containing protein [Flavobacterium sp.]
MHTFNIKYFLIFIVLFVIEVLIALYVKDDFVRPYVGDVLVVILIYAFIKSFVQLPIVPTIVGVLAFSFAIEFLQYLNLVEMVGIDSKILKTVLGTSFAWADLLAYTVGALLIWTFEIMERPFQSI